MPLLKLEPAAAARGVRSGSARQAYPSVADSGAGRTVGARIPRADRDEEVRDIAFDATIRAAAGRVRGDDGVLQIHREDLRTKVRKRKVGNLVLFVVDASASMGAVAPHGGEPARPSWPCSRMLIRNGTGWGSSPSRTSVLP